jgi:hypothetical protein
MREFRHGWFPCRRRPEAVRVVSIRDETNSIQRELIMGAWPIVISLLAASSSAAAEPAAITSLDDLVRMNECQLLELYSKAGPGPVPCGYAPGRAIVNPGKRTTVLKSNLLKHVWQGKYFDDEVMTNRIFGMKFIRGQVALETSWLDGRLVNAIEYSQTSLLFKPYRDEFREVSPGIYLGIMWKRDHCPPKLMAWFALDARIVISH